MSVSISIILCTYNRAGLLRRTLESLTHLSVPKESYEVIVVDDGSTDETEALCADINEQSLMNMRYVSTGTNGGLAAAANLGISHARGEYILFTDDDCIVSEDWCRAMSEALKREDIVAGTVASPGSPYLKLCHNVAEFHPFLPGGKAGQVEFIAGANMGFRRSVLERLGGFGESGKVSLAPDMELILRARQATYRIYFEPAAVVLHDHTRTQLSEIISYSASHAVSTILLRKKHKDLLGDPLVLRSPLVLLLASPLIALVVTFKIFTRSMAHLRYLPTAPVVFATKVAWCWGAARSLRTLKQEKTAQ